MTAPALATKETPLQGTYLRRLPRSTAADKETNNWHCRAAYRSGRRSEYRTPGVTNFKKPNGMLGLVCS